MKLLFTGKLNIYTTSQIIHIMLNVNWSEGILITLQSYDWNMYNSTSIGWGPKIDPSADRT